MRVLFLTAILFLGAGCESTLPEKVALVPGASNVEGVSEPPTPELYEAAGEVSATVIAHEIGDGLRQAANELRNQASKKGARVVSRADVSSHATGDVSGRVVVTITGTAFKVK